MAKSVSKFVPSSPRAMGAEYARGLAAGQPFRSLPVVAAEAHPDDQDARAEFIAGALDKWPRLELAADGTIEYVKHRPT